MIFLKIRTFTIPKVYNMKDPNTPKEAVYVGRPTKWGNPYTVKKWGRGRSLDMFMAYKLRGPNCLSHEDIVAELKGKDLACWCAPLPCHADLLLEIANE